MLLRLINTSITLNKALQAPGPHSGGKATWNAMVWRHAALPVHCPCFPQQWQPAQGQETHLALLWAGWLVLPSEPASQGREWPDSLPEGKALQSGEKPTTKCFQQMGLATTTFRCAPSLVEEVKSKLEQQASAPGWGHWGMQYPGTLSWKPSDQKKQWKK